jgi:hypothetical protein
MKFPFDIKYRPQIESGEYKVVTGDDRPVRIISWDKKVYGDRYEIVALVPTSQGDTETVQLYCPDGALLASYLNEKFKLFIITPDPELTEFETGIKRGFLCAGLEDVPTGIIKDTAKDILELAKKELCKDCSEKQRNTYIYGDPIPHTWFPPCYHGGPCTNPMHDCINCPRQSTIGINTTTGTSAAKLEG